MLFRFAFAICSGAVLFSGQSATADIEITTGYIENAWIGVPAIRFAAKLDTGAKTSSINASDYQQYKKGINSYVRFTITNKHDQTLVINALVTRFAKIHRANVKAVLRPVIRLKVCVAGKTAIADFTLANRAGMNYQILIGRKFLNNRILVNSSKQFSSRGQCN